MYVQQKMFLFFYFNKLSNKYRDIEISENRFINRKTGMDIYELSCYI